MDSNQNMSTRGTFESDRGNFVYVAYFWADEGAKNNDIGHQLLKLSDDLEAARTFDQLAGVYSDDSLPYLNTQRRILDQSVSSKRGEPEDQNRAKKRLTHLIIVNDPAGNDMYFARTEVFSPSYLEPGAPPDMSPSVYIDAFRKAHGVVKFDVPARENTIYEAIKFGEWDRFGLPDPQKSPLQKTKIPTSQP
jgi:hypothetical protein